jgi:hypothetical protein
LRGGGGAIAAHGEGTLAEPLGGPTEQEEDLVGESDHVGRPTGEPVRVVHLDQGQKSSPDVVG